jgi:uncharacterized membrane protein
MRTALFIHLLAMAFWLGGQLLLFVAMPALARLDEPARGTAIRGVARKFGTASVVALLVLLATGIWMMVDYDLDPGEIPALQHKLELVAVVLVATVVHTIAGAKRARRVSRVASVVTLLATLGVVWFATGIMHG